MKTLEMEISLCEALASNEVLRRHGCSIHRAAGGGIAVDRAGHHICIWRWQEESFALTPAAYLLPTIRIVNVSEAVQHTCRLALSLPGSADPANTR